MKYSLSNLLVSAMMYTLLTATPALFAQSGETLPRATPESQGVRSEGIRRFLGAAAEGPTEFHSYVFLRHGKVISEGWWRPYAADLKHTMYSCSKSFTATAVGFAASEKKLSLTDKVISFFPRELPDTVSPFLAELTVRDLLMMSTGMEQEPTATVASRDSDWVKGFLGWPIKNEPGTHFLYNTLGTFMLSAIVQQVTGEKVIDYLRPRLFAPLGITDIDWEENPQHVNTGGWGFRIRTEDMARFGQLFLQKGRWNGQQVLPVGWVDSASTLKIVQHPDYSLARRDSSDWEQGYCYQMWRCRHGAYRADGAFGQYIIMFPQQDAVIAITAETPDMQKEIDLVWKYLLPAMTDGVLPDDKQNETLLAKRNGQLALALPAKAGLPPGVAAWNGKTFQLDSNAAEIHSVSLQVSAGGGTLTETVGATTYTFPFGNGAWKESVTGDPGPDLVSRGRMNFKTFTQAKVAAAGTWTDDHTLVLSLRYIESPHTRKITFHLNGTSLVMDTENSFAYGKQKISVNGTLH